MEKQKFNVIAESISPFDCAFSILYTRLLLHFIVNAIIWLAIKTLLFVWYDFSVKTQ